MLTLNDAILAEMAEDVAKGAALLDEKRPGWERTVLGKMFDGLFNMTEWDHCIVGSLEMVRYYWTDEKGHWLFSHHVIQFNGLVLDMNDPELEQLGFAVRRKYNNPDSMKEYDEIWRALEDAWVVEIDKRLEARNV